MWHYKLHCTSEQYPHLPNSALQKRALLHRELLSPTAKYSPPPPTPPPKKTTTRMTNKTQNNCSKHTTTLGEQEGLLFSSWLPNRFGTTKRLKSPHCQNMSSEIARWRCWAAGAEERKEKRPVYSPVAKCCSTKNDENHLCLMGRRAPCPVHLTSKAVDV